MKSRGTQMCFIQCTWHTVGMFDIVCPAHSRHAVHTVICAEQVYFMWYTGTQQHKYWLPALSLHFIFLEGLLILLSPFLCDLPLCLPLKTSFNIPDGRLIPEGLAQWQSEQGQGKLIPGPPSSASPVWDPQTYPLTSSCSLATGPFLP